MIDYTIPLSELPIPTTEQIFDIIHLGALDTVEYHGAEVDLVGLRYQFDTWLAGEKAAYLAGWGDWFESNASHVGGRQTFTADEIAGLLRGPKPLGTSQGSED